MKNIRIIGIATLWMFISFSCIKEKGDLADCVRKIIIEFDWSMVDEPGDEEMIEVLITDEADEDESWRMNIDHDGAEVELMPRTYEFVGDEVHPNVILERCTVTVSRSSNGTYLEPGNFTGGSIVEEIDETSLIQIVTIPMRYQARTLIIRAIVNDALAPYYSGAEGTISGITMSREINDGFPPVDGSIRPPAIINGSVSYTLTKTSANVFSDQHVLLGTDGRVAQILSLTVYTTDGRSQDLTIDVTEEMVGFHTQNVREPWILQIVLGTGLGNLQVTIEDWQGNYESGLIVRPE